MKLLLTLVVFAALLSGADPAEVRSLLVNRVDEAKKAAGIVVGTIDATGRHVIAYGRARTAGAAPPDIVAIQLCGITKVFPGVVANDAIHLEVAPGEIHAVLGGDLPHQRRRAPAQPLLRGLEGDGGGDGKCRVPGFRRRGDRGGWGLGTGAAPASRGLESYCFASSSSRRR